MYLPGMKIIQTSSVSTDSFKGINTVKSYDMQYCDDLFNMDNSLYPALSTKEGIYAKEINDTVTGITFKNGQAVYTTKTHLVLPSERVALTLSEGEKTLINMGAYIYIFPDMIEVNTANSPATVRYGENISTTGSFTESNTISYKPAVVYGKSLYLKVVKSAYHDNYNKALQFAVGDSVTLSYTFTSPLSSVTREFKHNLTIQRIENYETAPTPYIEIYFDASRYKNLNYFELFDMGPSSGAQGVSNAVITKTKPEFDFVTEYNNRLWACKRKGHEICCSKLGDGLCWGEYKGISTDSYVASVGSDGEFTAVTSYGGNILFFKEDRVHIVYGTKASNFTVSELKLRGVQKGSEKSLCKSGGLLYYKAPEGIFAFNGSVSVRADTDTGKTITDTMTGVADNNSIYMTAKNGDTYVYDCIRKSWHREYIPGVITPLADNGQLYFLRYINNSYQLICLNKPYDKDFSLYTDSLEFCYLTGHIAGRDDKMRNVGKIALRIGAECKVGCTAHIKAEISYNDGEFQQIYTHSFSEGDKNGILIIPVIIKRCDRYRIRISGRVTGTDSLGKVMLYGIKSYMQEGSDIV